MRVLHVIPSISPLRGGPTQALFASVRALASAGVEVHVATTDDDGPGRWPVATKPKQCDGVYYHVFPRRTRFYTASDSLARWLQASVATYDVLHLHALFSFAPVAAAIIARRRGVPYVIRPLGTLNRWGRARKPWMKRLSMTLFERRILERAAAVQFTSMQEQEEARDWGVPMRSVVIPNVADPPAMTAPANDGPPTVLFLSRLDPVKGLDLLLPAFADVRRRLPEAHLRVCGSGEERFTASLERMAESLGLSRAVTWNGFVEGQERSRAYASADLFVLPSYSENFGLAAAEAMAHRLPVVVSDRVAIHREIAEAGAGRVVACDRERIAGAIAALLPDRAIRQQMGECGRRLVESRFSADAVAGALRSLYAEAAK